MMIHPDLKLFLGFRNGQTPFEENKAGFMKLPVAFNLAFFEERLGLFAEHLRKERDIAISMVVSEKFDVFCFE